MNYKKLVKETIKKCKERHLVGLERYGDNCDNLDVNWMDSAKEELYDTINYCFYMLNKLEKIENGYNSRYKRTKSSYFQKKRS